jgi:hypothetical protein
MRSMRLIGSVAAALIATCALTGNAGGADTRAKADVACRPAAAKLHYDCTIKLMNAATGEPLTGVDLIVNAEMPSMPMAHNVRPVKATAAADPGTYQAQLELEMHGVWALRLDVSGRVRDRVVKPLRFEDDGVTEGSTAGSRHEH